MNGRDAVESTSLLAAEVRQRPLTADDGAQLLGVDRSQAFRCLTALERTQPRVTSRLEAGPSGRGRRRVWRWS